MRTYEIDTPAAATPNLDLYKQLLVFITGEGPGTGASTLQKFFAERLKLFPFGAGFFRRAMALHWQAFLNEKIRTAQAVGGAAPENQVIWEQFAHKYKIASEQGSLPLFELLASFMKPQLFTKESIDFFYASEKEYGQDEPFFAQIPEMLAVPQLLKSLKANPPAELARGQVYEGKLAIGLHKIDKFVKELEPLFKNSGLAIIRFFLRVPDEVADFRVFFRDFGFGNIPLPAYHGSKSAEEQFEELKKWLAPFPNVPTEIPAGYDRQQLYTWINTNIAAAHELNVRRMAKDWRDYPELYEVDGHPISPADLLDDDVIQLNASKPKETVQREAFLKLARKLAHKEPSWRKLALEYSAELRQIKRAQAA